MHVHGLLKIVYIYVYFLYLYIYISIARLVYKVTRCSISILRHPVVSQHVVNKNINESANFISQFVQLVNTTRYVTSVHIKSTIWFLVCRE
jgi:hypothetical protein